MPLELDADGKAEDYNGDLAVYPIPRRTLGKRFRIRKSRAVRIVIKSTFCSTFIE